MKKQDSVKLRGKLEVELKQYRKLARAHRKGRMWLREIREALGMTVVELAYRLDCSRQLVYRIEECEARGDDRLKIVRWVAEEMGCDVIYAIVPRNGKTLEETAQRLKSYPRWRTEKQKERKQREIAAFSEKLDREHWKRIKKEKEERARSLERVADIQKLVNEWTAEKHKAAEELLAARQVPVQDLVIDRVVNIGDNLVSCRTLAKGVFRDIVIRTRNAERSKELGATLEVNRGKKMGEVIPGLRIAPVRGEGAE